MQDGGREKAVEQIHYRPERKEHRRVGCTVLGIEKIGKEAVC
jgi:hypothetical protein